MTMDQAANHKGPPPSSMTIQELTDLHAREICQWRYEAPFDIYNWPSWETTQKEGIEFGDSSIRDAQYAAVLGANHELIGFAQFFPIVGVTRLGLGMRPDLCGQGLGPAFVQAILREAQRRAPHNEIDLEVLSWNTRAIRAYERVGFYIADTYTRMTPTGPAECHCMVYKQTADS
ncbi:Mycothiol acetyltransferase [compost metagenome]